MLIIESKVLLFDGVEILNDERTKLIMKDERINDTELDRNKYEDNL